MPEILPIKSLENTLNYFVFNDNNSAFTQSPVAIVGSGPSGLTEQLVKNEIDQILAHGYSIDIVDPKGNPDIGINDE